MFRRLNLLLFVSLAAVLAWAVCAQAGEEQAAVERADTRHRISLSLGVHNFWPDRDPHEGTRPDDDGVVTEEEWAYIWDEAYRIQEFDGPTLELGYEYKFERWFGLAAGMGIYGGEKDYNFTVSGFDVKSYVKISVLHIDVMPRFHWMTRWTDLYGGPVLGYYVVDVAYDIDSRYDEHTASLSDRERGDGLGWGLFAGFEFRISKHFGVAIEDRLVSAIADEFEPEDGRPQVGGNVLTLSGTVHF